MLQALVTADYITQARANQPMRRPLGVKSSEQYQRQDNPFVFKFIEQQAGHDLCPHLRARSTARRSQHGLKIYTTINLADQAVATRAIEDNRSLIDGQGLPVPAGAGARLGADPQRPHPGAGNLGAVVADTADYAYPASRQTGSAFKVFALMTLIHDYDGDPNDTYYTSKPLPAGWTSRAPDWSVHTDDYKYKRHHQHHACDGDLRQHRVRAAGRRPGRRQDRTRSPARWGSRRR